MGWSGGPCAGTGACVVTLGADSVVRAQFNPPRLTVGKVGNGTGTLTSSPLGISCGADCTELYAVGTVVTLTATPAPGSRFMGWTAGPCSGTGTCTLTLGADTMVKAQFNPPRLTVGKVGKGSGTVASSPLGVSCGADCTELYATGTVVTLTATPAPGSRFMGWTAGPCSGTGTCTVTLSADTMVQAQFNPPRLTVVKVGTGTGTVTGAPLGISCGADCTDLYAVGTAVTLTAVAEPGSVFAGWTDGPCSGTGACTVTLSADTVIRATFDGGALQKMTSESLAAGAELVAPVPASILSGPEETFGWTPGSGLRYGLQVGSAPGAGDLYAADEGPGLSATVTGLPLDGRTVYVRLWTLVGGAWTFSDYTYTAAGGDGAGGFGAGTTTASPTPAVPGRTVTITTPITRTGPAVSGVTVRLEIHRGDGLDAEVFRDETTHTGLTFASGETKTLTFTWTVPAGPTPSDYVVKVGVFADDYSQLYVWDNAAARITVGP
jgi:hypothetical protein